MVILITGSNGMIGSRLAAALLEKGYTVLGIDRTENSKNDPHYRHFQIDLSESDTLQKIIQTYHADRIIHLAALAHTEGEPDLSWDRYYHINVECAKKVFESAGDIPVLFISTIDVYGFFDGKDAVSPETPVHPVSRYGKSKAMAEEECRKLPHYDIFRFSPVYTDEIKRDIQKRYYLKYPTIAYQIGKGSSYEVLNIANAVTEMIRWCETGPCNSIRIIKDPKPMWTPDYIQAEKEAGRAKTTLKIPRWMINAGYSVIKTVWGENEKTYLLNKAVHPLRSK